MVFVATQRALAFRFAESGASILSIVVFVYDTRIRPIGWVSKKRMLQCMMPRKALSCSPRAAFTARCMYTTLRPNVSVMNPTKKPAYTVRWWRLPVVGGGV